VPFITGIKWHQSLLLIASGDPWMPQMPRNYVMTLAPMRFTQPSIMMLVVGVASLPMENQHPETCLMPGAILLGVGRLQAHSCDKWLVTAEDNIQYGGHFTSHLAQIRDSWPSQKPNDPSL